VNNPAFLLGTIGGTREAGLNMKVKLALLMLFIMASLTGCGGPKADVTIFMMGSQGIPGDTADKLRDSLVSKVGSEPTLALNALSVFSIEKMVVELAAGNNDLLILPDEQFRNIGKQDVYVSLDDMLSPDEYPAGILEQGGEAKAEKHLYGIPLEETKWMKDSGMNGKGLVACIPQNAENKEQAKQVLKMIAEK
jgi:ABC-type glycerol-3-phosphate transport system substrate-binding protein